MGEIPTAYLVVCGLTREPLYVAALEHAAVAVALEHDRTHRCTPWIQYPLEHVHRDGDEGVPR